MAKNMIHHELVSRRITPSVAKHCGANTNQASNDKAVGKLQFEAMTDASANERSSPVADSA